MAIQIVLTAVVTLIFTSVMYNELGDILPKRAHTYFYTILAICIGCIYVGLIGAIWTSEIFNNV